MIVIDRRLGPIRDHLVFFGVGDEIAGLAASCRPSEVYRVRHALEVPPLRARHIADSVTSCIDLRSGPDSIYREMDAKSCRYEVRRAEKLGDRLSLRRNDAESTRDFLTLQNALVARTKHVRSLTGRRYAQYRAVSDVLVAYVDGTPVVGHLVVRDAQAGRVRLVFSASIRFEEGPFRRLAGPVNRWLHWQEFQLYAEQGLRTYDFGGVSPRSPIGRFKLSFGGVIEHGTNVVVAGGLAAAPLMLADTLDAARRRAHRARTERSSASS